MLLKQGVLSWVSVLVLVNVFSYLNVLKLNHNKFNNNKDDEMLYALLRIVIVTHLLELQ